MQVVKVNFGQSKFLTMEVPGGTAIVVYTVVSSD